MARRRAAISLTQNLIRMEKHRIEEVATQRLQQDGQTDLSTVIVLRKASVKGKPHRGEVAVSASPLCPKGNTLSTPPPLVLRGAAVSSEFGLGMLRIWEAHEEVIGESQWTSLLIAKAIPLREVLRPDTATTLSPLQEGDTALLKPLNGQRGAPKTGDREL
ncbi:hypothetical protein DPX16_14036 [Anabarilius grahami]|uniref:Uncharacterized protein n=1 Tax=Anabarilius grahami TaxID=495550 RepID=A0A3N0Y8S2_ANAGA|nr:hypothetical protein DPX16_14036 [Anabarilius grahami]